MFVIEVDGQAEADQVLAGCRQLIKKFDYLIKADLIDLVGGVGTSHDTKIGWTDLEKVTTDRTIDGLSTEIAFPDPLPLDI